MNRAINKEIREQIKALGLFHWQVADAIGISEHRFCQWLRYELQGERLDAVQAAIKRLSDNTSAEQKKPTAV